MYSLFCYTGTSTLQPRVFFFLRANHSHCYKDGPTTLAHTRSRARLYPLLSQLQGAVCRFPSPSSAVTVTSLVGLPGLFALTPDMPSLACFFLYQLTVYIPIYKSFRSFGPHSRLNIVVFLLSANVLSFYLEHFIVHVYSIRVSLLAISSYYTMAY